MTIFSIDISDTLIKFVSIDNKFIPLMYLILKYRYYLPNQI